MIYQLNNLDDRTVCSSCAKDIFIFFKTVWKSITMYERFVQNHVASAESKVCCEICNQQMTENEEYHMLSVKEHFLIPIADKFSEDIGGCEHCYGNEMSALAVKLNDDPDDTTPLYSGGSYYKAGEYLSEKHGVPASIVSLFLSLIQCPCGFGKNHADRKDQFGGTFSKDIDVYTKQEVDTFYGFDAKEFSEFAEQYGEKISVQELEDFREVLRTNPMLAYQHKTGIAIYNVLQEHYKHGNIRIITAGQMDLYRGRTRATDSNKPFSIRDLWTAPAGKSSHGRYNFIGVPVLYLADSKNAIPYEINPTHDQLIDIATFTIMRRELRLFDLGEFDPEFQGFFSESNIETEQTKVKSAYLLPNYIGACCSHIGYDGVVYSGVHDVDGLEPYTNYALFDMDYELDLSSALQTVSTFKPILKITLELQEKKRPEDYF
ncbi:RES family NAD+ phosphorylase [Paenibacillus sp. 276b]|uniref:RES family NAD+ phosphorylase n=1 Tax=Paenibacillus sp. 276b TaxID=1566277 RepID=UPI00089CE7F4|nr:RES family NAD+ phosphorylase [Paenibacillus sp. 276b]SEB27525.1 RES domain-containing protein [Paenibacillus sp. 276b]